MVTVNVGGLSEGVFESELFGHMKGAYTDAKVDRVGRFELADSGTLFLDEIANVPPGLQTKLLRILETGEFERVGSSKTRTVNVRMFSATNSDLALEVEEGGAHFWLATLSNPIQVYPDEDMQQRFAEEIGVSDLFYPDRRLAELAEAGELKAITLVDTLRETAKSLGKGLHGSSKFAGGHWNALGHSAAGKALARELCAAYK